MGQPAGCRVVLACTEGQTSKVLSLFPFGAKCDIRVSHELRKRPSNRLPVTAIHVQGALVSSWQDASGRDRTLSEVTCR